MLERCAWSQKNTYSRLYIRAPLQILRNSFGLAIIGQLNSRTLRIFPTSLLFMVEIHAWAQTNPYSRVCI